MTRVDQQGRCLAVGFQHLRSTLRPKPIIFLPLDLVLASITQDNKLHGTEQALFVHTGTAYINTRDSEDHLKMFRPYGVCWTS